MITQKFIQTGWVGISEDILKHREIMGIEPQPVDKDGTTCPYVMTYPASPHLAAEIDKVTLDMERIAASTRKLDALYDMVLLEGAGGLYVPVTRDYFTIDYIQEHGHPLILVASSKLGSINHTLMSLELCRMRGIEVACLVYNLSLIHILKVLPQVVTQLLGEACSAEGLQNVIIFFVLEDDVVEVVGL